MDEREKAGWIAIGFERAANMIDKEYEVARVATIKRKLAELSDRLRFEAQLVRTSVNR